MQISSYILHKWGAENPCRYVAPEVLKNKEPYSSKCDIFSVGCVAHALLSNGRVPRRHPRAGIVTSLPELPHRWGLGH